jgi:zinc D-Ala-D-Ala dipeptidase
MQNISKEDFAPVELHNELHERLFVKPMYYELGLSPSPKIYARKGVLTRLLKILAVLPQEYGLLIYDVYRPRAVQAKLFEWMRGEVRKLQPDLSDADNYIETKKYAAEPSIVGSPICAPHLSGGAIDLTLFDLATGKECDMGTVFDDCTSRAHRDYFTKNPAVSDVEQSIHARRELLQGLMESVGFVSYEYEWWHFDIGDRIWARVTGNVEAFGPLFGDEEWP